MKIVPPATARLKTPARPAPPAPLVCVDNGHTGCHPRHLTILGDHRLSRLKPYLQDGQHGTQDPVSHSRALGIREIWQTPFDVFRHKFPFLVTLLAIATTAR